MAEIEKYSLKEELMKADKLYMRSPALLGMTVLSYPGYINSMRSTMFTSHLKQFLNLVEPEFPAIFTNAENLVGKHNNSYRKTHSTLEVVRKVSKFSNLVDEPFIYKLFVFDVDKQRYDVITRKPLEDLTENFGFEYDTKVIDSLEEGDIVEPETVLYKSTSYDDDMNYAYGGRNVTVMYSLDPPSSEDAAIVSKSLSKKFVSIETETITIPLNDNDFLINLHGKNGEFRGLPEIGEKYKGHLAAIRRKFNNQLLYDFKTSSLNEIHEGDQIIYTENGNQVIDYTIYNNTEERPQNIFTEQINEYLDSQNLYYQEIVDVCEEIMNSGKEYTREIDYLYKRSLEMLDTKKKWREGDNAFSNVVIEVTIRKYVPLARGQKITGK